MNREQIEQRMGELRKQDEQLGQQAEILHQEITARQKALAEISIVRNRLFGAHDELANMLAGEATLKLTDSTEDGPNHDGQ